MANWIATKIKGLRYKEHEERKHGRQKDRYYAIRYTTDKKPKEEGLGWASEGWTEAKASALLLELKENNKNCAKSAAFLPKCKLISHADCKTSPGFSIV